MSDIVNVLTRAFFISGFIFIMMIILEFIHVQTQGLWKKVLLDTNLKKYALSIALGLVPGCLGSYTAVAMFSHRMISLGAVSSTMIATSGDEAFFMLAMFPRQALILFFILALVAFATAFLTDLILKNFTFHFLDKEMPLHPGSRCVIFENGKIRWSAIQLTKNRLLFLLIPLMLLVFLLAGLTEDEGNWIKYTIVIISLISVVILIITPNHFIDEHIGRHIFKTHIPRIFLWTLGALVIIGLLEQVIHLETMLTKNQWVVLLIAVLVGLIPSSGPHLILSVLFLQGSIPFSILLANSIVQDGHGTLPLLAESRKAFLFIKVINLLAGLIVGGIALLMNF